ncbi:efflux transporter periplasmic adaptor subunit [Zavarzinia compransoris]|uniref:Efflux transporter periplasmic adaptor subunit n=1 Tax=Zavarzinia compransoris TaxID=1264899 RepID=A0A317DXV9_9PROT|nr:efflux transporter periplasmic adaptor subunit [Zavarzinia compransoris]
MPPRLVRVSLTLAAVAVAIAAGLYLWALYMDSPWTRDGRVRADVLQIAPDVSGFVTAIEVVDNQKVARGDLLFTIDAERYRIAVSRAEATVAALQEQAAQRQRESTRRNQLGSNAITAESREQAASAAAQAQASLRQAEADLDAARLNLARTEVRAPVNGYVTNLQLHLGDYASGGRPVFAIVDSDSFYVVGYFEETKLAAIREGADASIRLMGFDTAIPGKVAGIARAIVDREAAQGSDLLANVNPTFSWVRLAQRIPVRIALGPVPAEVRLSAGMTATIVIDQGTN